VPSCIEPDERFIGEDDIERRAGPDKAWTVLRLQGADDGSKRVVFLRVDDSVLLVMDHDMTVLVGDASWSYALNRTDRAR
jgi:hypothetical protein